MKMKKLLLKKEKEMDYFAMICELKKKK